MMSIALLVDAQAALRDVQWVETSDEIDRNSLQLFSSTWWDNPLICEEILLLFGTLRARILVWVGSMYAIYNNEKDRR